MLHCSINGNAQLVLQRSIENSFAGVMGGRGTVHVGGWGALLRPTERRYVGFAPQQRPRMPMGAGHGRRNAPISAQRLLRLDARLADDLPPLRYFRPEARGAVLRRAGDRLVTERRQAFLHVRSDDGLR